MKQIDWHTRQPRQGWGGAWDRFVGPGTTNPEEWMQLGLGLLIGVGALTLYFLDRGISAGWLASVLIVVLALDMGGGIVTNATASAKRWYHRDGQGPRQHLTFLAVHGIHIAIVAGIWAPHPLVFFLLAYGMLMAAGAVIVAVPLYVQRPLAFGLYSLAVLASLSTPMRVSGLEWFLPLLYFKLLVSHLVAEAPFARVQQ